MIHKLKYAIELQMLLKLVFDCKIVFGQNFAHIRTQNYNIVFFVKTFTIEPSEADLGLLQHPRWSAL